MWGKKQKNCDTSKPADLLKGDQWDHTGLDVATRLIVSLVIGKRTGENVDAVIADFASRTGGRPIRLITTDDCSTYPEALLRRYGDTVVPPRTGQPGRPAGPYLSWPEGPVYATVNKTYKRGRVAQVQRNLVHGTPDELTRALEASPVSDKVNTSFVERQNGTDRTYNARKRRKTYEFSKDIVAHHAVTWWVMLCYNFHHTHRGLRLRRHDGTFLHRTPAMAGGLATMPWTVEKILSTQIVGFVPPSKPTLEHFRTPMHSV